MQKQRHYFANKGPSSQGYGFSTVHVWMCELDCEESWALKNWCFWTVVLRRLLRVLWTARMSNQPILKEISPGYSMKGLMLKLKLQYFGHLMWRTVFLEKNLMLGKTKGGDRGWDDWMVSPTHGHEFEWTLGDGDGQGSLACCSPWGCKELDMTEWLYWTKLNSQ